MFNKAPNKMGNSEQRIFGGIWVHASESHGELGHDPKQVGVEGALTFVPYNIFCKTIVTGIPTAEDRVLCQSFALSAIRPRNAHANFDIW